ncbi:aspartate kinase [Lottiidibacillus patelloidae]|uniref:Aspartokinase n=1 Tax=Lottiidibacillus patelloidae TaxID=2670334 RepID=A0A263BZP9_9BACI|nr:aspartate kinase [Lottiidibacillus patelloidae]OZM58626.1 aspartate kinase [Lottiidibacillus patelloidae]
MNIIVQKFGGTSLKDEDGRKHALKHVNKAIKQGNKVVVVVSAMGRNGDPYATDTLFSLIAARQSYTSYREQDLLLSCGETISSIVFSSLLNQANIKATALTGGQAGFKTNNDFGNAKIINMKCDRIMNELKSHDVVVVTGFQGATESGEITTLGRGGSDTSAAALGAALEAEYIDIFTDVEGVMTADPRIVSDARPLSVVTYTEICNMAYQGAKVIHPRAVEIAMQAKIPMRIRSTYSDGVGTLVTTLTKRTGLNINERLVTGIAQVSNVTQIKVFAKEGQYDLQAKVFKAMAEEKISVDFINISPLGVVYTVMDGMANRAQNKLESLGYEPQVTRKCAKISAVGASIAGVPGVTAKIVDALANEGVQILQSADSHTTIWVLVKEEEMASAVNALHKAFELQIDKQRKSV